MSTLSKLNSVCIVAAVVAVGALTTAQAQNANTPANSQATVPANVLSLADIESRMLAQGITIKEVEIEGNVVEVEGHDASGRKVELMLDRRSGEVLSRKSGR